MNFTGRSAAPPHQRALAVSLALAALAALAVLAALALPGCGREESPRSRAAAASAAPSSAGTKPVLQVPPRVTTDIADQLIYFVMPDRFANGSSTNDRGAYQPVAGVAPDADSEVLKHGFKPESKAYYHGGDLAGLLTKLPYLKALGVTAIWLTPVFKNKPVQGDGTIANSSAAYHGYWITDFLDVDPHLGTQQQLKDLVALAHLLDMKVFLDIITNHTADVIQLAQCVGSSSCPYRSKAEYPYRDAQGAAFDDSLYANAYTTGQAFPALSLASFPYTPTVPAAEAAIKNPAWLNNPLYYHNRGNSTFSGENSLYGDFFGLDDLFTEHPVVVGGMLEIYKHWIHEYRVDGFRIDTTKHVNLEFWQQFAPAIRAFAQGEGIKDFFMFGEVFDGNPETLSRFTTKGKLPAVLDFGFQGAAAAVLSGGRATNALRDLFANDDYFIDAEHDATNLPTFLGNHDMGRIGAMIWRDNRPETDAQRLARARLAHALLLTARGVPVVYYGDEQGFTGVEEPSPGVYAINDQTARQDMFPTAVPSYKDPLVNQPIGSSKAPGQGSFDLSHPLYRSIQQLAALRAVIPALRRGAQHHRYSTDEDGGGIYAFSRILRGENREALVLLNSHPRQAKTASFKTFHQLTPFLKLMPIFGPGPLVAFSSAKGEVSVTLPPLGFAVYQAMAPIKTPGGPAPQPTITAPATSFENGTFWIGAALSRDELVDVSFFVKEPGAGAYRYLGTDTSAPYRVRYDSSALPPGSSVDVAALVTDIAGHQSWTERKGIGIENRLPRLTLHYENGNQRSSWFGVTSTGRFLFPQATSATAASGIPFTFEADESSLTLFFETADPAAASFAFDRPILLDLKKNIYPLAVEDGAGGLTATIYISNAGQMASSMNYVTAPLPATLPQDPAAPAPLAAPIYVRGGMNGWGTGDQLLYRGSYTYAGSTMLDGNVEYKFADANWAVYNFGAPFGADGITLSSNPGNLLMTIPQGGAGRYHVHFFAYPPLATGTAATHYPFFRFQKDHGPLAADLYLQRAGGATSEATRLVYQGGGVYLLETPLEVGSLSFRIVGLAGSQAISLGAADAASAGVQAGVTRPVVPGGPAELVFVAGLKGKYTFALDASDPTKPLLTVKTAVDYGPFGPLYLRGGSAISAAGWNADASNLLQYDATKKLLTLDVKATSTSTAIGDWQFKIADANWGKQLTGVSGTWGDAANQVHVGVPYPLGANLETLYLQPAPGDYRFSVDVADPSAPVLLVTQLPPASGPSGPTP